MWAEIACCTPDPSVSSLASWRGKRFKGVFRLVAFPSSARGLSAYMTQGEIFQTQMGRVAGLGVAERSA